MKCNCFFYLFQSKTSCDIRYTMEWIFKLEKYRVFFYITFFKQFFFRFIINLLKKNSLLFTPVNTDQTTFSITPWLLFTVATCFLFHFTTSKEEICPQQRLMLTAETSKLLPLDYNTFTNKLLVSLIKWFNKSNGSAQLCTEDDNPRGLYSRSFNVFSSFVSSVACLVLEIFPCPVQTVQKTRAWSSQTLSPPICDRKQILLYQVFPLFVRWKEARRRREERTEEQSVTMRKNKSNE